MLRNITRKLLVAALVFASLLTAQMPLISAQTSATMQAEESTQATARRVLAELPAVAEFEKIENVGVRRAALNVRSVVQSIAENTNPRREATLDANLERAMQKLKAQTRGTAYETCAFKCNDDKNKCLGACKKKFCGCRLVGAACFLGGVITGNC